MNTSPNQARAKRSEKPTTEEKRRRPWNGRGASNVLPETAQVVAEVIGRNATLKLAAAAKHTKFHVPRECAAGHWIVAAIGDELARKFCKMFCGEKLCLAKCHAVYIYERNAKLRHSYLVKGTKPLVLANENGMSLRAVQYVLSPVKPRTKATRGAGKGKGKAIAKGPARPAQPPRLGTSPADPSGGQATPRLAPTSEIP